MGIEITVRPTNEAEDAYTYTQSSEIQSQSGCIGHLRADFGGDGKAFYSSWDDHEDNLKTEAFKEELGEVIDRLRFGKEDENGICHEDSECFLKDRSAMRRYCWNRPLARMNKGQENYGFRIDTNDHTYMMRLNPNKGEHNLYCYCYRRDCLEQHLKQAEQTAHMKARQKDRESER